MVTWRQGTVKSSRGAPQELNFLGSLTLSGDLLGRQHLQLRSGNKQLTLTVSPCRSERPNFVQVCAPSALSHFYPLVIMQDLIFLFLKGQVFFFLKIKKLENSEIFP